MTREPNLAGATTRELLEELVARGDKELRPHRSAGARLGNACEGLLRELPDAVLDCRTVEP